jgi:hypothetical protein
LICFVMLVLTGLLGTLMGVPFVGLGSWLDSPQNEHRSQPLQGLGFVLLGVLLGFIGLIGAPITAAILWVRRTRSPVASPSRVAAAALGLYFGILICMLLAGFALLRYLKELHPGPSRMFSN